MPGKDPIGNIERRVRIAERLADAELYSIEQFGEEADRFFKRRLEKFEKEAQKRYPGADDDFLGEMHSEMRDHRNLNGYFGTLMVFAVLERFFQRLLPATAATIVCQFAIISSSHSGHRNHYFHTGSECDAGHGSLQ